MPTKVYVSRVAWNNNPAITWEVTRETPREGLERIIERLDCERYNQSLSDSKFELIVPNLPNIYNIGIRIELRIKKDSQYYGNVAVVYEGACTDTSTFEHKTAQKYWVFFNFGKNSYYERNFFCT